MNLHQRAEQFQRSLMSAKHPIRFHMVAVAMNAPDTRATEVVRELRSHNTLALALAVFDTIDEVNGKVDSVCGGGEKFYIYCVWNNRLD